MSAYYNEHDPFAAAWLRELIKTGQIADGEVDERSIADVQPADVRGFTQCHWFAGIGGWSYALRLAGWDDARPVWTGSCPCQPFSAAGANLGGTDPRHLWPAWFRLIRQCRPTVVFGEQVESAINHGWFDLVCDDLEREGYAVGAAGIPACGVGAFHVRQRLWFVADAGVSSTTRQREHGRSLTDSGCGSVPGRCEDLSGDVGDSVINRHEGGTIEALQRARGRHEGPAARQPSCSPWADVDWLDCRDQKRRPVESGTFPLAYGVSARVGRLRGYGNAIVPQVAQAFIEAYLEAIA